MDKKKLESRVAKTKTAAKKDLARREKLNIRFSEAEIERIFEAAERNNTRVMPMLRAWIIRALESDESRQGAGRKGLVYSAESSGIVREPSGGDPLLILMNRLSDVETRVNRLEDSKRAPKRPKRTQ